MAPATGGGAATTAGAARGLARSSRILTRSSRSSLYPRCIYDIAGGQPRGERRIRERGNRDPPFHRSGPRDVGPSRGSRGTRRRSHKRGASGGLRLLRCRRAAGARAVERVGRVSCSWSHKLVQLREGPTSFSAFSALRASTALSFSSDSEIFPASPERESIECVSEMSAGETRLGATTTTYRELRSRQFHPG